MSNTARVVVFLIGIYRRAISPAFPRRCRFEPTCSAYTIEAVREYGALRGVGLGVWRILRCHPFNPGGVDPVPRRSV
jgi:putative membrane protein insertion efficiency factor